MTPTSYVVTDHNGRATKVVADFWENEDGLIVFHQGGRAVAAFCLSQFHSLKVEPDQAAAVTVNYHWPEMTAKLREFLEAEGARTPSGNR